MIHNVPITVVYRNGIDPEIMTATLDIIKVAAAHIDIESVEVGEKVYVIPSMANRAILQRKIEPFIPVWKPGAFWFVDCKECGHEYVLIHTDDRVQELLPRSAEA